MAEGGGPFCTPRYGESRTLLIGRGEANVASSVAFLVIGGKQHTCVRHTFLSQIHDLHRPRRIVRVGPDAGALLDGRHLDRRAGAPEFLVSINNAALTLTLASALST